jgi:hypothetical protein
VGSVMLERHRVHRDADGDLPAAVTAPLLAHPPSPAEPWPANFGSSEITDEEIDAASAACCRICLESESEPGEPPPQLTAGVPYLFFFKLVRKAKDRGSVHHWIIVYVCRVIGS